MSEQGNHSAILSRTLTSEFYRANAMFFLVVLGLCFGFMRANEHIALGSLFVSTPFLLLIPAGVWVVYTIKVIMYNNNEVRFASNYFLYSLPLLDYRGRIPAYITVAAGQLGPVIAYGLFLGVLAFTQQQFVELLIIIVVMPALIAFTALSIHRSLLYPEKDLSTSRPVRYIDKRFSKGLVWLHTEGILRMQPGLVYVTKIATCLVIYGATQLYAYDVYDERLYLMAACVAFSANLAIAHKYQEFEVVKVMMMRSLPIPFIQRMKTFTLTMVVLCVPEIAILASSLPDYIGIQFCVFAILFGLSLLILGYGSLYLRSMKFDDFTRWIFFVSMGLLLLILFSVPVWMLAIVQGLTGAYLLNKHYYSFEVNTQP